MLQLQGTHLFEALKLFRAEIEKRKEKKKSAKMKAAVEGDFGVFRRLHDNAHIYSEDESDGHDIADVGLLDQTNTTFDSPGTAQPQHSGPVLVQAENGDYHMGPQLAALLKKAKEEDIEIFMRFLAYRQRAEQELIEKRSALRRAEIEAELRAKVSNQCNTCDFRTER